MKRNVIITNKNGKYELNDELPNDLRLKKILKLHGIVLPPPPYLQGPIRVELTFKYFFYLTHLSLA